VDTKRCTKCKEIKTLSEFYANKSRKDGKTSNCKLCMKEYRAERRDYYTGKHREWTAQNRDHVNAYNRDWVKTRDDAYREAKRRYNRDLAREAHREALRAYGGFCACCGEAEVQFLQIDHVDNDGADHRRSIKGVRLGPWLKRRGYPEGFQVLCANCNFAKHTNGGSCPHQTAIDKVIK